MTENGILVKIMPTITAILFIMCLIPETQVKPKITIKNVMNTLKKTELIIKQTKMYTQNILILLPQSYILI